jgi:C4-dicarboxylate-specific signal transduction histidine kinase
VQGERDGRGRGRLIVVDDEPVLLQLLCAIFDGEPYEVVGCADGATALRAFDGGVDVLLTDKNLPDVSGLTLLQQAKARFPDCEGIVITGYASLDTALAAMALDAYDYIVKPPKDVFEVRRRVRQAFEKVWLTRENAALVSRLRERNESLERALSELRDVQAELVQSEKLAGLGTLAAGIAHEISSPLFGVMGLAEAIAEEPELSVAQGYAKEIVAYSQQIRDIVQQLTGYSRSAGTEFHTAVDLVRAAEDAVRLVTRTLAVDASRVTVTATGGGPIWVQARASELQQVFVNLVKNGLEALSEGQETATGRVAVLLGRDERWAWARVTDDGPGIPESRRKVIFDPFFTTKAPGRGTGLGLNIVYRILTRYHGTITVDSEEGAGATFALRLPLADAGPT